MGSDALVVILAMALVTYATRAAGLWLMGRVRLSPRIEAGLRQIPGAVLAAIVAPDVLASGLAESLAALAAVLVMARTGTVLFAMAMGVGTVVVLRQLA